VIVRDQDPSCREQSIINRYTLIPSRYDNEHPLLNERSTKTGVIRSTYKGNRNIIADVQFEVGGKASNDIGVIDGAI
jgi:hypothetical protein